MQACAVQEPIEVRAPEGQRVSCWLHGPDSEIDEAGRRPLERQEFLEAEEA
jgi:peptide/nickel transport system ATP-binding protein